MDTAPILQEIRQQMRPDTRIWVAYSGGLDSTTLLHIISQSNLSDRVRAIHVNHQLSPMADDWEHHCVVSAHDFGIPCDIEKVEVANTGRGIEQAARQARYTVFEKYVGHDDIILFAHHLADLSETVLFRLMRGAGLKGLAAMQKVRVLGKGKLFRPLLHQSRMDLLHYAQTHHLHWVEDDSNHNTDFDRNYVRHRIFPVLEERWPDAKQKIARSSLWLDEADALLSEYGHEDLLTCNRQVARFGERIELDAFLSFSGTRQKNIIRIWCDSLGYSLPDTAQLDQLDSVLKAKEDANPCLSWGNCELRRYQSYLYLVQAFEAHCTEDELQCRVNEVVLLPDGSRLTVHAEENSDLVFSIRFRSEGIRGKPKGRAHSQTLKKLLQEYRVEPWLRDRIPLIYAGDELVAVGDVFKCDCNQGKLAYINIVWSML